MTEAEVERVRQESWADYIDPATRSAACFDEYCAQEFERIAAEHAAACVGDLPEGASVQEILASIPTYDAQAAVRSALAAWIGVVRERAKASVKYNCEHARASAVVLPIIGQSVRDADKIGSDILWQRRLKSAKGSMPSPDSAFWCDHVYVPPLGSGHHRMDENFTWPLV